MRPLTFALLLSACLSLLASPANESEYAQPEKFDLGKPATEQEIKAQDIDVRPDGAGLPKGAGSVAEGEKIYQQKCVACHGERGEGGINEKLAGRLPNDEFPFAGAKAPRKTIGNYWPYATTLFDYLRRTMPYTESGSLTDQQTYSVTAYLLYLNTIIGWDTIIDQDTLPKITMPARHRFKNDDRLQFNEAH